MSETLIPPPLEPQSPPRRAGSAHAGLFLSRPPRSSGPPETSVMYLDALTAPSKRLVWFEDSGHEPFMDEPEKFNRMMVDLVWPVSHQVR
jgi:pimeloyl-ACP methyl ester carboxylesterase